MLDLKDRTAVVTGASSGIGRAAALKIAAAGGIPILVARSLDKLEEAKAEIEAAGGTVVTVAGEPNNVKLTVADDTVFTGSFNLSRSGELNAENVLEVTDPELAERLAEYVDEVRARYPLFSPAETTVAPS